MALPRSQPFQHGLGQLRRPTWAARLKERNGLAGIANIINGICIHECVGGIPQADLCSSGFPQEMRAGLKTSRKSRGCLSPKKST